MGNTYILFLFFNSPQVTCTNYHEKQMQKGIQELSVRRQKCKMHDFKLLISKRRKLGTPGNNFEWTKTFSIVRYVRGQMIRCLGLPIVQLYLFRVTTVKIVHCIYAECSNPINITASYKSADGWFISIFPDTQMVPTSA